MALATRPSRSWLLSRVLLGGLPLHCQVRTAPWGGLLGLGSWLMPGCPAWAGLRLAVWVLRQHPGVLRWPLAQSPFRGDSARPSLPAPIPLGWSGAEAMPAPAWCCLGP